MVDPELVRSRLGKLETFLRGLADKQDCTLAEYQTDRDRRDVVERRFEKAIQASLDVGSHVVASEGYREPENYGDVFTVLGEEGVLSQETADLMVEMAGFRNVLAHEYAAIDDDRVYHHLQDLERFRTFAGEVQEFLNET